MADPAPRLLALDALRGAAVMGILLMNIVGFAMPDAAYFNPAAFGGASGADLLAWLASFVLVDGKMRLLFSLLFGAGLWLVTERAEAAGDDPIRIHYRRMAWLLGFGLVHAFLIWSGDILIPYALTGMAAFLFVERSVRALLMIAALLLTAQWLLLGAFLGNLDAVHAAATLPGATAEAVAAWDAVNDHAGRPSPAALARELAVYRGNYLSVLGERLRTPTLPLLQLLEIGPETLALMLLGMAGVRSGFLTGAWARRHYARIAAGAYAIGLPALALIAARTIAGGFDPLNTLWAAEVYAAPLRPVVMLGHVALVLWLLSGGGGAVAARIAAAGRMAFSNYLGASIVMTTLFYGYGFGLYGRLGRAELIGVVLLGWVAMLLWSPAWLRRFRYGPLEWLWRSLARGRFEPMRRTKNVAIYSQ